MIQNQGELEKVKHLLRRFGLGASEAEVTFYGSGGYRQAVDKLLASDTHPEPYEFTNDFLKNKEGQIIGNPRNAQVVWYAEQLVTNRPLTYKMALFWHDHFATSAQKVSNGPSMLIHLHLLRDGGLGYFRDLLLKVSQDPAMLYWLDNIENLKGKPNENFAREIMELFTLGEGHYTEKDIQEAARSFTGWSYGIRRGNRLAPARRQVPPPTAEFVVDEPNHDTGEKTIFGNKGPWTGEDVIGMLVAQPRTSYYITEKIWKWFVEPNPKKATIEKFAQVFRKSGNNIKVLIKEIMLSEEFQSEAIRRVVIKNPCDFALPMVRQLGVGASMVNELSQVSDLLDERARQRAIGPAIALRQATSAMGMELLYPPDVAGWEHEVAWITTSTMVERISFGQELFLRNGRATGYPAQTIFAAPDAKGLVDRMLAVFDVTLAPAKVKQLEEAAESALKGQPIDKRNAHAACGAVAKLLCATPEFQFC
jgi:uncharacterized protein (DUF1800 family)